jgi:6-phosphogluconolactonase (cycloisomerase 2 family)
MPAQATGREAARAAYLSPFRVEINHQPSPRTRRPQVSLFLVCALLCGPSGSFAESAAPTVKLTASPGAITLGESTTLTWSSTGAASCKASGAWSGSKATSGEQKIVPDETGDLKFELTCTGSAGSKSDSATLTVDLPPAEGFVYTLNGTLNNNETGNISAYRESVDTGALILLPDSPIDTRLKSPSSIAVDQEKNLLFAAGGAGGAQSRGSIVAFTIDPETGHLSDLVATTPNVIPSSLVVGPSGKFLFVSSHTSDAIAVYAIGGDGSLTEISGSPFTIPGVDCGLFCEATADALVYDPSAETLYVISDFGWFVATFTVDASTGALRFVYNIDTDGAPGPITVSPSGKFVYATSVTNVGGNGVVNSYTVTTGSTTDGKPQPITPILGQPFKAGNSPVSVVAGPTGTYLYTANATDRILVFHIESSGALSSVPGSPIGIAGATGPSQLVVDPSGKYLYLASTTSKSTNLGGIDAFTIDPSTGLVTEFPGMPYPPGIGANQPFAIAVYKKPE